MRWGWVLTGFILVSPLAAASSVGGILAATGDVTLPPRAELTSAPEVLYAANFTGGVIETHAASVAVRIFEFRYVTANALILRPSLAAPGGGESTWSAQDAIVRVTPARQGWVGIRPAGELVESTDAFISLSASEDAKIGNGFTPDAPEDAGFLVPVDGRALAREASSWTLEGGASIKVYGPDVMIRTNENITAIETGEFEDPAAPAQLVRRWVILEHHQGTLEARGVDTRIVSRAIEAKSDGPIEFDHAEGMVKGGLREWKAGGTPVLIDGVFEATVRPAADGEGITFGMTGALRSTSMTARLATQVPAARGADGLAIVVALAIGAAGTAYIARKRGHLVHQGLGAEEMAMLAEKAADEGNYTSAIAWMERARRLSPTSSRLALDQAFFVSEAGDVPRALRLLDAALIRDDPDALVLATRLHLKRGDPDAAEASLILALARAPAIHFDVEADETYGPLLERTSVRAAMRQARDSFL